MTIKNKEPRVANSVEELELLMWVALQYKELYYKQRPIMNFLYNMGYQNKHVAQHCTDRAMLELTNADYDHDTWTDCYGDGLLDF